MSGEEAGILLNWCLWHETAIMTGQQTQTFNDSTVKPVPCSCQVLRYELLKHFLVCLVKGWHWMQWNEKVFRFALLIEPKSSFLFLFTRKQMINLLSNPVMVKLTHVHLTCFKAKMLISFLWNLAEATGKNTEERSGKELKTATDVMMDYLWLRGIN